MGYQYLDHLTWADVAFEATGSRLEDLFRSAAEAMMGVMVSSPSSIREKETRPVEIRQDAIDLLLHDFLQRFIFYKDADQLLLKTHSLQINETDHGLDLHAELSGETIDPARHDLVTDVKAVTMHQFLVEKTPSGWRARVVLDV